MTDMGGMTGLDMFELGYMHGHLECEKETDHPDYLSGYREGKADYMAQVKREEQ